MRIWKVQMKQIKMIRVIDTGWFQSLFFGKHGFFYIKNFLKTQNGKQDWKFHILDQWHWAKGLSRDNKNIENTSRNEWWSPFWFVRHSENLFLIVNWAIWKIRLLESMFIFPKRWNSNSDYRHNLNPIPTSSLAYLNLNLC